MRSIQRLREVASSHKIVCPTCANHTLSELAALAIAVDIESTLVEQSFYAVFETKDPETKHTLEVLTHSADAHLRIVREKWQVERAAAAQVVQA